MRMNEYIADVGQGLLQILSDPAFLSALGSLVLIAATALSKQFKTWVNGLVKKWKKRQTIGRLEKHLIPSDYLRIGLDINDRLKRLRESLDCSRAAILQFRNGTNFTLSSPMFRIYGSYESLRPGVRPSSDYFKERLGTTILELLAPILGPTATLGPGAYEVNHKCARSITCPVQHAHPRIIKYVTEELPYCTLRYMLEEAGVRVMYGIPLKSGANTIGILVMHYMVDMDVTDRIEAHICEICDATYRIQGILDARQQNA